MMAAAEHAEAKDPVQRAAVLVGLFHPRGESFASFTEVAAAAVPQPHRDLLDHRSHMTAAMERHHGGPVSLRVVACEGPHDAPDGSGWYAREILLLGPTGAVVQHGIVRIDLAALSPPDAALVRGGMIPLGRVLMSAGVLCRVHDVALLAIEPGPSLAALIGTHATFGRVATIRVDGRPAIELLEIVVEDGDR